MKCVIVPQRRHASGEQMEEGEHKLSLNLLFKMEKDATEEDV